MKYNSKLLLLINIFIFSLLLLSSLYNANAKKNFEKDIKRYIDIIENFDELTCETELQKAEAYNNNLNGKELGIDFIKGSGYAIPENYDEILNIEGIMGYIEIPKINVILPIYHGTSEDVLNKGVGHMKTSSFPVGGMSTHSVLFSNNGYRDKPLFKDLDKLELGDIFILKVLNKELEYKVDKIKVVNASDMEELDVVMKKDYVTLGTSISVFEDNNRLIVRGERIIN